MKLYIGLGRTVILTEKEYEKKVYQDIHIAKTNLLLNDDSHFLGDTKGWHSIHTGDRAEHMCHALRPIVESLLKNYFTIFNLRNMKDPDESKKIYYGFRDTFLNAYKYADQELLFDIFHDIYEF